MLKFALVIIGKDGILMRKKKESVAKLVREIISLKPIVLGCIELGIVNYSSLDKYN